MLQAASQPIDDYGRTPEPDIAPISGEVAVPLAPVQAVAERYRARSRPNIAAITAIVVIHALAIGALIHVRNHVRHMEEARLTVVNLSPPPPPPAAETPPPPPSKPEVVAPPPIVRTPVPPVQTVQTRPDPAPQPTPVTVAPPAPPVPAPAPPIAVPSQAPQNVDLTARLISAKPPRYPIESRRKREQGTVKLGLIVAPDGSADKIWIANSSGFDRLDKAALDAVRKWRWAPMADGKPARGWLPIPFVIQG